MFVLKVLFCFFFYNRDWETEVEVVLLIFRITANGMGWAEEKCSWGLSEKNGERKKYIGVR